MGGRHRGGKEDDEAAFSAALGHAIKVLRIDRGLDRRDLARQASISYSYVSEIENGRKPPSSPVLVRIAQALGMPLHELMRAVEERADYGVYYARGPVPGDLALEINEGPRWFHSPRLPHARPSASARSEPESPEEPLTRTSPLGQALREFEELLPRLSPQDAARLLDLARRLAE